MFIVDIHNFLCSLDTHKFLGLALLFQEEFIVNTNAVEKQYDATIEETLAIGAAPDDVECEIIRWKLGLTISQLYLASFEFFLFHEDAFCTSNSDLECAHLGELEILGDFLGQLC